MADSSKAVGAGIAAVAMAPILVVFLVLMLVIGGSTGASAACNALGVTVDESSLPSGAVSGYQGEQLKVAAVIINTGARMGISAQGQRLGVMTGMGESSLRNLNHGDEGDGVTNPDGSSTCSLGVFQQQWCLPGEPWGSKADVTDVAKSTQTFFKALQKLSGWESLEPWVAAHRVQGNYSPAGYTKYWDAAGAVMDALANVKVSESTGSCAGTPGDLGKDDDYGFKSGLYNANNPITGFAYKNCTDFAWWRMMQQLGITDHAQMDARGLGPGNAITWGPTWNRVGWTVTATPKVGAVIWYGPGNPGGDPTYGHVAIVKAITADGKVLEEGYNMGPDHLGGYYTRTIAANSPSGYLLIPSPEQFAAAS